MGKHVFKGCQIENCVNGHYSQGLCKKHYQKAKRNGDIIPKVGNYGRHGCVDTPEYNCWCNIKARCDNPNTKNYELYGLKGVKYCERWAVFENFLEDMGKRPGPDYSIDRIDPIGDYTPENCRWVLPFIQSGNKTKKRLLKYNGLEMNEAEWVKFLRNENKIDNRMKFFK